MNELLFSSRKYQSSTQNDLWEALTSQAHADSALDPNMSVKEIMDTWTLQTGFPVIMVTRDYTTGNVHLKQVSSHSLNIMYCTVYDVHYYWVSGLCPLSGIL
jgi:aminopeptidase N